MIMTWHQNKSNWRNSKWGCNFCKCYVKKIKSMEIDRDSKGPRFMSPIGPRCWIWAMWDFTWANFRPTKISSHNSTSNKSLGIFIFIYFYFFLPFGHPCLGSTMFIYLWASKCLLSDHLTIPFFLYFEYYTYEEEIVSCQCLYLLLFHVNCP